MNKTIVITTPIDAGEVAFFKLELLTSDAEEWIDQIESVDCVVEGEQMGIWKIV